jgi:L-asparaginase
VGNGRRIQAADYNEGRRTRESVSARFISVMKKIRILVTGGTFDKKYDELTGRLFFRDTHVPEMLRLGRCRLDVTVETVMMIDSLELDDHGRARIVERVRDSDESAVVVTHGTDTMVQTARAVADASLSNKTVVLTGAMVPYAFGSSDGLFNLGSALSFVQVLPAGVYIAMNGRHFPWNVVRKNTETGSFELVNTP